jgi:hypothetical protein
MNIKALAIAAIAALSLGTGAATTANAAPVLSASPAISMPAAEKGAVSNVSYGYRRYRSARCRRLYILGYRFGNARARFMFNRMCRRGYGWGYSNYRRCKALYVRGFVYGNYRAKRAWYRLCRGYRGGYRRTIYGY